MRETTENNTEWWKGYPWRMIQTNLRETDMADMNAEKYAQDLQDMGATVVLLNAAGIIASYETKLGFQTKSAYLHGDSLQQVIAACHSRDIRVIARTDFSKVRYALYEKHPEWACRTEDGDIINYNGNVHVCPNSDYQQKYMLEILKEVLTELPFDGVFFNMSGFLVMDYDYHYYGPCHCENCKKKFREMYGAEIPDKNDTKSPSYMRYTAFKNRCMKEHKQKVYETIKSIRPGIAVNGFDYIRTESNTEIGRPQWIYSASSNCRLTCGPDHRKPADNACVDFIGFPYRDISVSPEQVSLRHCQGLANAGSLSLYIMGRLDNHRDRSSFEPTRRAFAFHKAHEYIYTNMKSAARVCLLRARPAAYPDPEADGWVRILTESHIPFDEMMLSALKEKHGSPKGEPPVLSEKDVVILSECRMISAEIAETLDEFVCGGGTVIACGETGLLSERFQTRNRPSLDCLGVDKVLAVHTDLKSSMFAIGKEQDAFPRCRKTPYIMPGKDVVEIQPADGTEGLMNLIGEHPFGPPEQCYFTGEDLSSSAGLYVTQFGKGKGIYIPWQCGTVYYKEGYANTRNFLQDVLFQTAGIPELAPELSPMVEMTLNHTRVTDSQGKERSALLLQLVNGSGYYGNSFFQPVPMADIAIRLPAGFSGYGEMPEAKALNGGTVTLEKNKDDVIVHLDRLDRYEAIIL